MVSGTRQSARIANQADNESAKPQAQTSPKGTKRKADATSPKKARGGKAAEPEKKQKTLEETIDNDAPNDEEMTEAAKAVEGTNKQAETKGEDAAKNDQQEHNAKQEQPKKKDKKSGEVAADKGKISTDPCRGDKTTMHEPRTDTVFRRSCQARFGAGGEDADEYP